MSENLRKKLKLSHSSQLGSSVLQQSADVPNSSGSYDELPPNTNINVDGNHFIAKLGNQAKIWLAGLQPLNNKICALGIYWNERTAHKLFQWITVKNQIISMFMNDHKNVPPGSVE
jgi:hypothetical protein